jgi:hypothetical protein
VALNITGKGADDGFPESHGKAFAIAPASLQGRLE